MYALLPYGTRILILLKIYVELRFTIQASLETPSILARIFRSIKSGKDFMLSKVQKYIDPLSSTPHLEAFQEACQLFEKERDQWKQERLELLKCIEALEVEVVLAKERVPARSIEKYLERVSEGEGSGPFD